MIRSLIVPPAQRRGLRDAGDGRGERGGLWRRPFAVYWSATSVSTVGSGVTLVALPVLAAQQLSAGPAQLGYLRALETVPYLLLALPAGQLADRVPPLRVMITADAVRAVLLAATTVLAFTGGLRLGLLYLVMMPVGACTVGYDVAQFTVLPSLVPPASLRPAGCPPAHHTSTRRGPEHATRRCGTGPARPAGCGVRRNVWSWRSSRDWKPTATKLTRNGSQHRARFVQHRSRGGSGAKPAGYRVSGLTQVGQHLHPGRRARRRCKLT